MDEEPMLRGSSARRPLLWFVGVLLVAGALTLGGVLTDSRAGTVAGVILLIACSWALRRWVFRRR